MADTPLRTIAILGGGTAGWMTAAAFAKELSPRAYEIMLIESEDIGTVGVGEATVPPINLFNAILGLDVPDFMRACEATFKLGIEFVDWGGLGRRYMHPFTHFGADVTRRDFPRAWMQYAKDRPDGGGRIDDYNLSCIAAAEGRFTLPRRGQPTEVGPMTYAFHFDASLYARYLRAYAEKRGVKRVEGKVVDVTQDSDSGFVQSVTLASGQTVDAFFFVDCSGFPGLLIEKALKTGYEDWSHWLPCDRALAVPSKTEAMPAPVTRSTADAAGWRWRIPLQHRVGNGHVYCSRFMSDDEAEQRLLAGLDGPALARPRPLRFVTGRRRQGWNGNCVAIGLASGFLEPLESTSIHMIQTAIIRILSLFPHRGVDPAAVAEFNRLMQEEFESIRDFIILHYKLTERDDTPFWRYCRDMAVPEAVTANLEQFAATGRVTIKPGNPFPEQGWTAVLLGQGLRPDVRDLDVTAEALEARMHQTRETLGRVVAAMPTQAEFLKVLGVAKENERGVGSVTPQNLA
ncbi:MAG TPA: tryptophan halogenase family protein [Asticcacaulis sp.]|nr:tryptophan halogenase family protein [Asticcacaulis sp.]